MSCCPPDSLPYLASDYNHSGAVVEFTGAAGAAYVSGADSERGLIVVPDIYGWNGGRTRNIADWFAKAGYLVAVPKILDPPLNGGTDGDGCPPDYKPDATFMPWMQTYSWAESFKPKIAATRDYLVSRGVKKIVMIGFCFGGLVVAKTLVDPDLGDIFVGGASPHPSIQLEQFAYGGSIEDLCAAVTKPMLILPASSDSPDYDKGGKWCGAGWESIRFPDMFHGWVPRGDVNDPKQAEAIIAALEHMSTFFAKL